MSDLSFYSTFPNQLKTIKERTDKWYKECVDAAINYIHLDFHGIRQSYDNKLVNYNLYNDIFDEDDLKETLTPLYAKSTKFPVKMMHYPIAVQKIDLLVGEELKRKFNFTARVTNDDAITQKEEEKDKVMEEFFIQSLKDQNQTPEEFEKALKEKIHYLNLDYQDTREKLANQILKYYWTYLDMKELFNRGFADLLISSEEIYKCDILGNEPLVMKCDPLKIHIIGGGESIHVEDADIIIEDRYMSPSEIIDLYHDVLTETQIKDIEDGLSNSADANGIRTVAGSTEPEFILIDEVMQNRDAVSYQSRLNYPSVNINGEIRVSTVSWKSRLKVGVRTFFDEEGNVQQDIVHQNYKKNAEAGDIELKWIWINEALEGTRIGGEHDGIHIKMQPRDIQHRRMDNISKCSLGYVGIYANVNTNRAMSLMDRLKPYQYLYNLYMNKLNLIYSKYKGPIYRMDFSGIPDDYEVEEWMYYADLLGWELWDPFNAGKEGPAQGKLAGAMNQTSGVKDANLYSAIQQTIDMLNYIEMQAGSISGITKAREGQIQQREAVSNVTREITQSAHITEKWFNLHDQVKRKTLELFLETAKHAFKGRTKKVQYVLDDLTTQMLFIDGEMLNEAQYGIQIVDTSEIQELFNALKDLAHAGIQNDKVTFGQLIDIYTDNSIASIKRKIEQAEREQQERAEQANEVAKDIEEMKAQAEELKQDKQNEVDLIKQANEIQKDILIARMEINSKENISEADRQLDKELAKLKAEVEKQKIKAIGKSKSKE